MRTSALNTTHDLIAIANRLRREISVDIERQGYEGLRPSFAPLFGQVWSGAVAQSDLADRLGVSLAAVSQLVTLGERLGYLARRVDPGDGRVRLVELTTYGRRFTRDGVRAVVGFADRLREQVGEQRYAAFDSTCVRLLDRFGLGETIRLVTAIDRRASIVAVVVIADRYIKELRQVVVDSGFGDLGGRENTVLVYVGGEGVQASDLARQRGVSRQAVTATLHQLEALGYLRRKIDRGSKGVLFVRTARGTKLINAYVERIDQLDKRAIELIGRRGFTNLATTARELRASHALGEAEALRRRPA